ncbi:rod shape-determining protein MreD [Thiomicrospira aerophila AL3]|uniref:Rod shape-determining protein MreD n=1 Tax=Thiomicrospira aerophila AL3 TaxID=717772 RepID=W0DU44_9GAMM|nr:rod shape-determining protein MreD [Thiomicrospira aerophila]AHF00783.1 rod shape-determining protein MreD [Thiomicrospira aerophila AL3]
MTDRINDIEFSRVTWLWLLSYFVALTLNAINLQLTMPFFLPPLALIIAFFWTTYYIHSPHLISVFILGLLYDGLYQSLLGMHALLFVLLMFLMLRIRLRFRSYRIWQQSLVITFYLAIYQLTNYLMNGEILTGSQTWHYWTVPLLAGLLWVPIYMSFRWIISLHTHT